MSELFKIYAAPKGRPAFAVEVKTRDEAKHLLRDFAGIYGYENVSACRVESIDITDTLFDEIE
jgi:hypothetical protein